MKYTQPVCLADCIMSLKTMLSREDLAYMQKSKEFDWVAQVHHSIGRWIRNSWNLWQVDSVLARYFHHLEIYHADDMSGIILHSFWRDMHNVPLNVGEQITQYQEFWQKQGVDIKAETLNATVSL